MKPGKHQGANKDAKVYVARFTTVHNLLFCAHTLCMNYVTNTFLLVSSSVRSKQLLCFVHCQGQKREQKHTTKNFVEFQNHSPLLTMGKRRIQVKSNILKIGATKSRLHSNVVANVEPVSILFHKFHFIKTRQ